MVFNIVLYDEESSAMCNYNARKRRSFLNILE